MSDNLFDSLPVDLSEEVIESIIEGKQLRIERIISRGHTSSESSWYDQQQNEWVLVLQGSGILEFENGEQTRLNAGDYINIPAHEKHPVKWTEPDAETI